MSPVVDLINVLTVSELLRRSIDDCELDDDTVVGYDFIWVIVGYASCLLGRPAVFPENRLARIRRDRCPYPDVALDCRLLDALDGRARCDDSDALVAQLAAHERGTLAAETYRTYLGLIDSGGGERADALVRTAEAQYRRQGRDGFHGGGPAFQGGGPNNPYMVDFRLAAILKAIGWTGESIHRWLW